MRKGFWEEILYAKMEITLTKTHLRTVFVFLYHYEKSTQENNWAENLFEFPSRDACLICHETKPHDREVVVWSKCCIFWQTGGTEGRCLGHGVPMKGVCQQPTSSSPPNHPLSYGSIHWCHESPSWSSQLRLPGPTHRSLSTPQGLKGTKGGKC